MEQSRPAFEGNNRLLFQRDMEVLCTQLVSVATDYRRDLDGPVMDPRTCLSGYVVAPSSNGFLMAVRDSPDVPPHIFRLAQQLHDAIQAHYRNLPNELANLQGDTNESGNNHYSE
jgi:hypothetical protein